MASKKEIDALERNLKLIIDSGNAKKLEELIPVAEKLNYKLKEQPKVTIKPTLYESYEYGALEYYVDKGDFEMVDALLKLGADPNFSMSKDSSPLYVACLKGDFKIADILLENDSTNVNFKDQNGVTPLHLATMHNDLDMIKMLWDEGADTQAVAFPEKDRAKIQYNLSGTKKKIQHKDQPIRTIEQDKKELFKKYIGPDEKLYEKQTPLHIAMMNDTKDAKEIIKLFAEDEEFNPNLADSKGRTAASYALKKGDVELMEILIEKGLDANSFIAYEESINGSSDLKYATTLHHAVSTENVKMVELLLEKGHGSNEGSWLNPFSWFGMNKSINVNCIDENGISALSKAAAVGNFKIVKMLVESGADLNKFTKENFDEWIFDTVKNEYFKKLTPQEKFNPPIYEAAKNNNLRILKYLVKHGAKLDIKQTAMSGTIVDKLISEKYDVVSVDTLKYLIEKYGIAYNPYNLINSSNKELAAYGKQIYKEQFELSMMEKEIKDINLKINEYKQAKNKDAKDYRKAESSVEKKHYLVKMFESDKDIAKLHKQEAEMRKKLLIIAKQNFIDDKKQYIKEKGVLEVDKNNAIKDMESAKTAELKQKASENLEDIVEEIKDIEAEIAKLDAKYVLIKQNLIAIEKTIAYAEKELIEVEKNEIDAKMKLAQKAQYDYESVKKSNYSQKAKEDAEQRIIKAKEELDDLAKQKEEVNNQLVEVNKKIEHINMDEINDLYSEGHPEVEELTPVVDTQLDHIEKSTKKAH